MSQYRRPAPAELLPGGAHGNHVLSNLAADRDLQSRVEGIFCPAPLFDGYPCVAPLDPTLVKELLDYAPQTDRTGEDDWNRPARADERTAMWGTPFTGDPVAVRNEWLHRAHELCCAWGRPLFGQGGLVPGVTVPPE